MIGETERVQGAADRIDSWKAIAVYLGRGLRTVQRWEREEGLPVRRHVHSTHASVHALRSELDAWRRTRERAGAPVPAVPDLTLMLLAMLSAQQSINKGAAPAASPLAHDPINNETRDAA